MQASCAARDLDLAAYAPSAVEDGQRAARERRRDDRAGPGLHVVGAVRHARHAAHAPVAEAMRAHAGAVAAGHERDAGPEADVLRRRVGAEQHSAPRAGGREHGQAALAPGAHPHPPAAGGEGDVMGQERGPYQAAQAGPQRFGYVDDGDRRRARSERRPQRPAGRIEADMAGAGADLDAAGDPAAAQVEHDDLAALAVGDEGVGAVGRDCGVAGRAEPAQHPPDAHRARGQQRHGAYRRVRHDDMAARPALDAAWVVDRGQPAQHTAAVERYHDDVRLGVGGRQRYRRASACRATAGERGQRTGCPPARERGQRCDAEAKERAAVELHVHHYVPAARGGPRSGRRPRCFGAGGGRVPRLARPDPRSGELLPATVPVAVALLAAAVLARRAPVAPAPAS
jgi:hypothetical protein